MPLRLIVPAMVRRSVLASLSGQGMGRFSYSQMLERADCDLIALESLLADDRPFLFGETATSADASVVGVLASIAASPAETELRLRVTGSSLLMNYISRVADRFSLPVQ